MQKLCAYGALPFPKVRLSWQREMLFGRHHLRQEPCRAPPPEATAAAPGGGPAPAPRPVFRGTKDADLTVEWEEA